MNFKRLSKMLWVFASLSSLLLEQNLHAKSKDLSADIVIIGGGTAGCALANRLSEKYDVILLEAGTDQSNNPLISVPSNNSSLITKVNYFFWEIGHWVTTNPVTNTPRFIPAPAGKLLGGGSSVNGLQFVRSTASYFNQIAAISGDSAWAPSNVFNVYNQLETFNGIPGQFNPAAHGFSGPVNVRQCVLHSVAANNFVAAAAAVTGSPAIPDYNDPTEPVGPFVNWQVTELPNETRAQSFQAYLQGILKPKSNGVYASKHNRIVLYTNARAEQVLFSDGHHPKAKGVKAVINGEEVIFQAKKKVIIAAGYQSPVLLQLSGIGDASMLKSAGIPVVYDNPNVGKVMFNHLIVTVTGTGVVPSDPNPDLNNLYTGGAFLRDPTRPADTDRGFQWIGIASPPSAFTIAALGINLKSKGQIGVIGSNPLRMPIFSFNYFTDPVPVPLPPGVGNCNYGSGDMLSMCMNYQLAYQTLVAMGLTPLPSLPVPDITDCVKTTAVINHILSTYSQAYHWVGSCSMGKSAQSAVVDSSGHVFGVKDLIVADITIAPLNCRGNTQGIAYLIGNVVSSKLLDD